MPVLPRFATPANLTELRQADVQAWSDRVGEEFAQFKRFDQFYNPLITDTPTNAPEAKVVWSAFPADLRAQATSEEGRWQLADGDRENQDEYCEWAVERDGNGQITRVTFTTEVPEYFEHVAERDQDRLLALYHELVSADVALGDLFSDGAYDKTNTWNNKTVGRPAHLMQGSNTLGAAIQLAAEATVLREKDDKPVTDQQALIRCGALGEPLRNSDPQIAATVNNAAAGGAELTLADPPGLYIQGLLTGGMETPDGADPAGFWMIERGSAEMILRASFAVPDHHPYTVSHITIEGRPIRFGAQLADRVQVRLVAVVKPAHHHPKPQPCVI